MNSILLIASCVGILCIVSPSTAETQQVYVQRLPYYPSPTRQPRPVLVRRSANNPPSSIPIVKSEHGSASGNIFMGESNKLAARVSQSETQFLNGLRTKPSSGSVDWSNANGTSASVGRDINKGVSDTFSKSLTANLYNNDRNRMDATFSQSNIRLENGHKFDKTSGLLNWSNSYYSGVGKQATVTGYTNLFTSDDRNTRENAYGGGSQWLSWPFNNNRDYGIGFGISHDFRG